MLPEVTQYFEAAQKAHDKWTDTRRKTNDYDAARKVHDEEMSKARDFLLGSDNELIKWMAGHPDILRYRSEAEAILRRIPAPIADLDRIARQDSWCGVYRNFRDEAIKAGVINVDYDIQYRSPGRGWQPFPPDMIYASGDTQLKREFVNTIFNQGVRSFTLDFDGQTWHFQLKELAY